MDSKASQSPRGFDGAGSFNDAVSLSGLESGQMSFTSPTGKSGFGGPPTSSNSGLGMNQMNQFLGSLGTAALARSLGLSAPTSTAGSFLPLPGLGGKSLPPMQNWTDFVRPSKFSIPRGPKIAANRLMKNTEKFISNYLLISLLLVVYCILTSPLLLIVLAAIGGAAYLITVRQAQHPLVLGGRRITLRQQYLILGVCAIPVLWLVGASNVLFWILGASIFTVVAHATLYKSQEELEEDALLEFPTMQNV